MPRVFVAIPVPPAVRSALASLPRDDRQRWRWVREEQFHITLKFLGDIAESQVVTVAEAVSAALRGRGAGGSHPDVGGSDPGVGDSHPGVGRSHPDAGGSDPGMGRTHADVSGSHPGVGALNLAARGVGAFPDPQRARVLWAGVAGEVDKLRRVQAQIEAELAHRGFPRDRRRFSPHITLARARREGHSLPDSLQAYREHEFGGWTCEAIQIIESRLEPSGPRYIVRHEIRPEAPPPHSKNIRPAP